MSLLSHPFFFLAARGGMGMLLGQGLSLHHSCNQSHSNDHQILTLLHHQGTLPFNVCGIRNDIFSFIQDFGSLCPLSLFCSVHLARVLSTVLIFINKMFWWYCFSLMMFRCQFLISGFIFIISLLLHSFCFGLTLTFPYLTPT